MGYSPLFYYWVIVALYMMAPRSAYYFMELVEGHAHHTYDTFLKENEAELKAQPAPQSRHQLLPRWRSIPVR
jgi:ubiquinol oxidase